MQMTDAMVLKKSGGDKPCDHPELEKEYYLGANTGDFVCSQCGQSFTKEEKVRIDEKI